MKNLIMKNIAGSSQDALNKARKGGLLMSQSAVYVDSNGFPKLLGRLEFFGGSKKWYGKVSAVIEVMTPEGWISIAEFSRAIGLDKSIELKENILHTCGVEDAHKHARDFFEIFADANGIDRAKILVV